VPHSVADSTTDRRQEGVDRLAAAGLSIRQAALLPETADDDRRVIRATIATEQMVQVFDLERFEVIDEILLMENPGPTIPRQMPFIQDHMSFAGTDAQIGSVRDMTVEEGEGGTVVVAGDLHFVSGPEGSIEERAWRLARGGHAPSVSIGYRPTIFRTAEPGQSVEVNGRKFEAGDRLLRVASGWVPRETSHVLFGADDMAQMRSAESVIRKLTRCQSCEQRSIRGEAGGGMLAGAIDAMAEEEGLTVEEVEEGLGEAMTEGGDGGISSSTVGQIKNGEINCPPRERIEGAAAFLGIPVGELIAAFENDGCDFGD